MDELPDDIFAHILSLCTIRQVCVCMSVSRKWEAAARYAIRVRESIFIWNEEDSDGRDDFDVDDIDVDFVSVPLLAGRKRSQWMKSLLNCTDQMECLVAFFSGLFHPFRQELQRTVKKNATTLRTLIIPDWTLPYDGRIVYPRLRRLECKSVSDKAAAACPVLQKLEVSSELSKSMFKHLPAGTMRELDCSLGDKFDDADFVDGVTLLIHLEKLTVQDMDCQSLQEIFRKLRHLTDVSVDYRIAFDFLDDAVATLVQNNPDLQSLNVGNITDRSLISISRLSKLESLTLDSKWSHLSAEAMLTLLRGPSRHTLQMLSITNNTPTDWSLIEAEMLLLSEETGREVDVFKDQFTFNVDIVPN